MQFSTFANITIQLPEGIDYSAYACGDIVDATLFGVVIRVTPDSVGVSFEGETDCATVYAPKRAGLRQLGYISGASREHDLTARWDQTKHAARLDAWVEHGPQVSVDFFEDAVVVNVTGLSEPIDLDEIVSSEPLSLREED